MVLFKFIGKIFKLKLGKKTTVFIKNNKILIKL